MLIIHNNAGIHTIVNVNKTYDSDLIYYERKARKERETERRREERVVRECECKNEYLKYQFDSEIESYIEMGQSLVDIISSNMIWERPRKL